MAALTDAIKRHTRVFEDRGNYVIQDAEIVYPGGFVGVASGSGLLVRWSDTVGLTFVGLVDAIVGGGSSGTGDTGGTVAAVVLRGPILERVAVTGASVQTDAESLVYATSDQDLTLTPTTNVDAIGYITKFHTATQFDVKIFTGDIYRAL